MRLSCHEWDHQEDPFSMTIKVILKTIVGKTNKIMVHYLSMKPTIYWVELVGKGVSKVGIVKKEHGTPLAPLVIQ